ncbi:hypothetical protein C8R47DRAFT_1063238 [Mycena vitilis]|nr:hypothetical protein C8R47DRAFT_1063238 [Mycena vitilis]
MKGNPAACFTGIRARERVHSHSAQTLTWLLSLPGHAFFCLCCMKGFTYVEPPQARTATVATSWDSTWIRLLPSSGSHSLSAFPFQVLPNMQTQRLPAELERYVFEQVALSRTVAIPRLLRVAQRVKIWIEPLLYRTIVVNTRSKRWLPFDCCPLCGGQADMMST